MKHITPTGEVGDEFILFTREFWGMFGSETKRVNNQLNMNEENCHCLRCCTNLLDSLTAGRALLV